MIAHHRLIEEDWENSIEYVQGCARLSVQSLIIVE
jgi:hypothetical protein